MSALLLWLGIAWAESPKDILQRAIDAQKINNSIQTVEMYHRKGAVEVQRGFVLKIRREENAIYSHTQFYFPQEISGMQLARIDTPSSIDPVLVYLPALNIVRKANVNQLDKPFMGSDFALADFEMHISENDQLDLLQESEKEWKIQCVPYDNTLYQKLIATIDKASKLPLRIEYFDARGHLKTLTIDDIQKKGAHFVPIQSTMSNHRTGSSTKLLVADIQINVSKEMIPLYLFTEEGLKNAP